MSDTRRDPQGTCRGSHPILPSFASSPTTNISHSLLPHPFSYFISVCLSPFDLCLPHPFFPPLQANVISLYIPLFPLLPMATVIPSLPHRTVILSVSSSTTPLLSFPLLSSVIYFDTTCWTATTLPRTNGSSSDWMAVGDSS